MQRNDADSFYFFDLDFFLSLHENMGQMLMLALTYMEGKAITTELVLTSGKLAFAFLGGTLGEYYQYKANTFQRWELVKYLCEHGFDIYSMGASIAREDSIYKFKKSFARDCVNPFYIGIKVHLPEVYAEIRNQWQERYPEAAAACEQSSGLQDPGIAHWERSYILPLAIWLRFPAICWESQRHLKHGYMGKNKGVSTQMSGKSDVSLFSFDSV